MRIRGKCHCGNISFSLTWDPDDNVDPALLRRVTIP
jgi:hypothetical protein